MSNGSGNEDFAGTTPEIQAVYGQLRALEQEGPAVSGPEALEALERAIRELTERLAARLLEHRLQANPGAQGQLERERELLEAWPGKMKNEGFEEVRIRTSGAANRRLMGRAAHRNAAEPLED